MNIDIEKIEQLMRALREHDFDEIEIRQGDERVRLRRSAGVAAAPAWAASGAFPMATGDREAGTGLGALDRSSAPSPQPAADPSIETVTAPLVGTFYRAASPNARAFVEVGSLVRTGTVLCIIEAMKLMNEIESEADGVVTEVLVENGKPVEFGQPLVRIRRSA